MLERAAVDRVVNASAGVVRVFFKLLHVEGGVPPETEVVAERLRVVHVVHVAHELFFCSRQFDDLAQLVEVPVNVRRGGEAARVAEGLKGLGVASDSVSIGDITKNAAACFAQRFAESVLLQPPAPYVLLAHVWNTVLFFKGDKLFHLLPHCALFGTVQHDTQKKREREREMCDVCGKYIFVIF